LLDQPITFETCPHGLLPAFLPGLSKIAQPKNEALASKPTALDRNSPPMGLLTDPLAPFAGAAREFQII
jgi:hypothetical protein